MFYGLLTKGMTPAFQYMFYYYQQVYDNFWGSSDPAMYTTTALNNPNSVELLETKMFILNNLFTNYKDKAQL